MKNFAVLGMGRFGVSIASTLCEAGYDVMAVDKDPQVIQEVSSFVTHSVVANCTDEAALRSIGIQDFDTVIIAMAASIETSILTTVIVKDIGVNKIIAKANSNTHSKILKKVGADYVVFPEEEMGRRIAKSLTQTNIMDFITLSDEYSIVELLVPHQWYGKTLSEINPRARFGINIMAIKQGNLINISPDANDKLNKDDVLVVIGSNESLEFIKGNS